MPVNVGTKSSYTLRVIRNFELGNNDVAILK